MEGLEEADLQIQTSSPVCCVPTLYNLFTMDLHPHGCTHVNNTFLFVVQLTKAPKLNRIYYFLFCILLLCISLSHKSSNMFFL